MGDAELSPLTSRLDRVLERIAAQPNKDSNSRAVVEHFEAVVRAFGMPSPAEGEASDAAPPTGLAEALLEYAMPQLEDSGVLQGDRCFAILEELAGALGAGELQDLAGQKDALRLAPLAVRHELRRLKFLRRQMNSLIEA